MPVVFSPGEVAVKPVDPDQIVYTTAQKVADLLNIGPGEAVAVSADSDSDGVYITGADYRDHGVEVGETILIYSDQDPLGIEKAITAITNGGASGIKLGFDAIADITVGGASYNDDPTITHTSSSSIVVGMGVSGSGIPAGATVSSITSATVFELSVSTTGGSKSGQTLTFTSAELYQSADNTYVQNTASFTNGKTRGVKKSHVEQRIKEVQDKIDNITHNSWRPYLVAAEYINFDTYKPYRRRYYTDYVGTTPLLFRNVQQILRLELWQGDSYREIAGAEAKINIVDHGALSDGVTINLCPGGGGTAALPHGPVGGAVWTAKFDNITTAQSLADLINKDERVGNNGIAYGPSFHYEDSTSSTGTTVANVNHDFLATANSDYGNGVVKITSKKSTKAGETSTIACDDLTNLTISQVTNQSATTTVHATGVLVNNGGGYSIGATSVTTDGVNPTTTPIFSIGDRAYNSAGDEIGVLTGVGATTLSFSAGTLVALANDEEIYSAGIIGVSSLTTLNVDSTTGFSDVGLLMIENGASTRVAFYTGKTATSFTGLVDTSSFFANVGGAAASRVKGTAITQYQFALDLQGSGGDEGRLRDWWLDSEMGIIYFNNSYPFFEWNAVKVSYIYGERYLEKAIEEAATKLVACDLLMADDRSILIPEGTQNVDLASKIQLWQREAEGILNRYKEVVIFE